MPKEYLHAENYADYVNKHHPTAQTKSARIEVEERY
jgi:hypothetical protein